MRKVVDQAKRRLWRERLSRFARSGQKVAAFCSAERVSVPTFYQWKRKLASQSAKPESRRTSQSSSAGNGTQAFVPVRIEGAALVQMELPNGTHVRVPAGDLAAIGAAIAAAGRLPIHVDAEASRC
jgi:hypothetical protein